MVGVLDNTTKKDIQQIITMVTFQQFLCPVDLVIFLLTMYKTLHCAPLSLLTPFWPPSLSLVWSCTARVAKQPTTLGVTEEVYRVQRHCIFDIEWLNKHTGTRTTPLPGKGFELRESTGKKLICFSLYIQYQERVKHVVYIYGMHCIQEVWHFFCYIAAFC